MRLLKDWWPVEVSLIGIGVALLVWWRMFCFNDGRGPNSNPLDTLSQDEALVCVQVADGSSQALQIQTLNSSSQETAMMFWDSQLGHCAKLPLTEVGSTWLLPQHQQMFLTGASVTTWENGWNTHQLEGEQGGWWVH